MQAVAASPRGNALWRYNYKILIGSSYWILVLPVAASQIVTLWMFALQGDFNDATATHISELMAPILGAFLVAHSMAPEYRSGIGSVLACKPVSLHRVVTIRVGLAMLIALALTLLTLGVCSLLLTPVSLGPIVLVSLPSLWFLAMVALTCATLFRNALAGFGAAAALWALDVWKGYDIHPLLSLQGRHALLDADPLASLWIVSKVLLLVMGMVLLIVHGRLIPRVCRPPERQDILKIVGAVTAVLLFYCVSGAAAMLGFAYVNRARLSHPDHIWLRRQLHFYDPIPVARLFGPDLFAYVHEPSGRGTGKSDKELLFAQFEQALARWPNGLWADGIGYALGHERSPLDPQKGVQDFLMVASRHGQSPFAPRALGAILRLSQDTVSPGERQLAARRLIADYPKTREAERAADVLHHDMPPGTVRPEELLRSSLVAAEVAPRIRRPTWYLMAAELEEKQGDRAGALAHARQAYQMGLDLVKLDNAEPGKTEIHQQRATVDETTTRARLLVEKLGGGR